MTIPRASIIICTHNPTGLLEDVIHALSRQDGINDTEILIVDNASNPPVTVPKGIDLPLRVISERALGLSHARNAGIAHSSSNLIIFLDDDALPQKGWLASFLHAAEAHPDAGSFGGYAEAVPAQPLPPWISPSHLRYFGAFDRGPHLQLLAYPDFPRGCNMMLRRSAVNGHELFAPMFGRRGKRQTCFEEIDLCWRMEQRGWNSMYVPGARVKHMISAERFKKRWFWKRIFEQGRAVRMFERHRGLPASKRMVRFPLHAFIRNNNLERIFILGYIRESLMPTRSRN